MAEATKSDFDKLAELIQALDNRIRQVQQDHEECRKQMLILSNRLARLEDEAHAA
jgi:hypothetical protein